LGEQLPLDEGLHFTASLQSEGTARVFWMKQLHQSQKPDW
jgi:hypothetical protein